MIITLLIIYILYLQKFAVFSLYSDNNEVLFPLHSKLVVCFTKPITENTIMIHLSVFNRFKSTYDQVFSFLFNLVESKAIKCSNSSTCLIILPHAHQFNFSCIANTHLFKSFSWWPSVALKPFDSWECPKMNSSLQYQWNLSKKVIKVKQISVNSEESWNLNLSCKRVY